MLIAKTEVHCNLQCIDQVKSESEGETSAPIAPPLDQPLKTHYMTEKTRVYNFHKRPPEKSDNAETGGRRLVLLLRTLRLEEDGWCYC